MANKAKESFIDDLVKLPKKSRKELLIIYGASATSDIKDFPDILKKPPSFSSKEPPLDDIKAYLSIIKRLKLASLRYLYGKRFGEVKYNQLNLNNKRSKRAFLSTAEAPLIEILGEDTFESVFSPDDSVSVVSVSPLAKPSGSTLNKPSGSTLAKPSGSPLAKPSGSPQPKQNEPAKSPKGRPSIPSSLRSAVWRRWADDNALSAKCFCCKSSTIEFPNFHCGHVVPASRGGDVSVDNLRPVCQNCNLSMGNQNMDDFMRKHGFAEATPTSTKPMIPLQIWVVEGAEYSSEEDLYVAFPWMFQYPKWRNIFEENDEPQFFENGEKIIKRTFYFVRFEYENWFARKTEDYSLERELR